MNAKQVQVWRTVCLVALGLALVGCAPRSIWLEARNGKYKAVQELIQKDPQLVNAQQTNQVPGDADNRWTPLHYAVTHQHEDIARLLLDHGADPLAAGRGGWTPLHAARQNGNKTLEKLLVQKVKDSGREMP